MNNLPGVSQGKVTQFAGRPVTGYIPASDDNNRRHESSCREDPPSQRSQQGRSRDHGYDGSLGEPRVRSPRYQNSENREIGELAQAIAGAIREGTSGGSGRRAFRRPERFDGKQHWNDYLTHFEMCADLSGWNIRDRAKHLAASLDGQALQVVSNLSPWERVD